MTNLKVGDVVASEGGTGNMEAAVIEVEGDVVKLKIEKPELAQLLQAAWDAERQCYVHRVVINANGKGWQKKREQMHKKQKEARETWEDPLVE